MRKRGQKGLEGQVVVEMILILPVFLTIVFTIMEMGNLAFHTIVLHHAAWEVARIGSMRATPPGGGEPSINTTLLESRLQQIFSTAKIHESHSESTVFDNQAKIMNHDLVLTVLYPVPLIFPLSSFLLSKPVGSGRRNVLATVRMPIERPLSQ